MGQYFKKYRGIATGLGSAGSGLGTFGLPPMMDALFGHYGFMGTFLILGAIMLNVCVCGALHRPLEANLPPKIGIDDPENKECLEPLETDTNGATENAIMPGETGHASSCNDFQQDSLENGKSNKHIVDSNGDDESLSVEYKPSRNNQGATSVKLRKSSKCDINEDDSNEGERKQRACANLNKYIDLSLCNDPVFMVFMLALGTHTMSYMAAQMLVPANAQSLGHSRSASVFLLSILGICDMCGRTASGFIFDAPFLRKHRHIMYNTAIVIAGSSQFLWAFCQPYALLVLASAVHGVFNGCVVSQRAVILADLLGVQKLSSSFGLTVFVQGCGILIGPPFAGNNMMIGNFNLQYNFSHVTVTSTS